MCLMPPKSVIFIIAAQMQHMHIFVDGIREMIRGGFTAKFKLISSQVNTQKLNLFILLCYFIVFLLYNRE